MARSGSALLPSLAVLAQQQISGPPAHMKHESQSYKAVPALTGSAR